MSKSFRLIIMSSIVMLGSLCAFGQQGEGDRPVPWWKQQKIRFIWGQGFAQKGSPLTAEERIRNFGRAGATIYADCDIHAETVTTFNMSDAKAAKDNGIRYFGSSYVWKIPPTGQRVNARRALDEKGNLITSTYGAKCPWQLVCPQQPEFYEKHIFAPTIEAARSGLVDGLHFDWEAYQAASEPRICYCDACFDAFLQHQKTAETKVIAAERGDWLDKNKRREAYWDFQNGRRFAMWNDFAKRVRLAKPDFIFSAYLADREAPEAMLAALHEPATPIIFTDTYFYYGDAAMNWWDSRERYYRKRGFIWVPGMYDNTLFGGQPISAVEASRWLYEASTYGEGSWLWYEQEVTPELWQTLAISDRKVKEAEAVFGDYFSKGVLDDLPISISEISGNPLLLDAVIARTHHLDDRYLLQLLNVDPLRPVSVKVRFPSLSKAGTWTIRDGRGNLYYSPDGRVAVWTREDLAAGLPLDLPKRSDQFLIVAPAEAGARTDRTQLIGSHEITPYPKQPLTVPIAASKGLSNNGRLLFTSVRAAGFGGVQGARNGSNAIFMTDISGSAVEQVVKVKGELWAPRWSPDGKRFSFTYDANGRGQLFATVADGSKAVNASRNEASDRDGAWSPDGKRLAFVSDRDGNGNIYVTELASGATKRITSNVATDRNPVWSPDGRQLAFESNREGDWKIFLVKSDGTDERRLKFAWLYNASIVDRETGNELSPAWSPDGKQIACSVTDNWYRALCIVTIDGGAPMKPMLYYPHLTDLTWSPDGKKIAGVFESSRFHGKDDMHRGIFTIDANGENLQKIVKAPPRMLRSGSGAKEAPTWYSTAGSSQPWIQATFTSLNWSPDGKQLSYSTDAGEDGNFRVYVVDAGGGEPRAIKGSESVMPQAVQWQPN